MTTYYLGTIGPDFPPFPDPNDEFFETHVSVDHVHFSDLEPLVVIDTRQVCPDCDMDESVIAQTLSMSEAEALYTALEGALAIMETLVEPIHDELRQARIIQLLEEGTQRRVVGGTVDPAHVVELTGLVAANIVADRAA